MHSFYLNYLFKVLFPNAGTFFGIGGWDVGMCIWGGAQFSP